MTVVPLCPPIRLRHNDPYEPYPDRPDMPGKWPMTYENFTGRASEDRVAITKHVLEEIDMLPPPICSCCGRPLAGDLPEQYEIAGTWDNFGPDDAREPCSPSYLSVCRQPWGLPDWDM
jgi:hypothetical protein